VIELDGSQGEGGGQIVRSALALSMCTGRPFRIANIRARRRNPGLQRQHLVAVRAAAEICGATVEGATRGSTALSFTPGEVRPGRYHFDIGTAGSATLVLQTLLPALLAASAPARILIEGGTHNPLAPSYEFIERSFLPVLRRMGARVAMRLLRHGFYPMGGGQIEAEATPCPRLSPPCLLERGAPGAPEAHALVARLPLHIAERELDVVRRELPWPGWRMQATQIPDSRGPGNVLTLIMPASELTEVVSVCGRRGVPAEEVAMDAVRQARRSADAAVPVGEHLADQLIVPITLAGGGEFRTVRPSNHTLTNIAVVERFLPLKFTVVREDGSWRVAAASMSS
jgi:RNA 3'-terminal phosphate cyclase (ATP)